MKDWKQKKSRDERKGLIVKKEDGHTVYANVHPKLLNYLNLFAGFPRVKGSWNNLWRWDTLEDITL